MLNKDVAQLYASRARDQALLDTMQTEQDCRENRENELEVTFEARELLKRTSSEPEMDYALLDAAPSSAPSGPVLSGSPELGRGGRAENCQNEPPVSTLLPSLNRGGSPLAAGRGSDGRSSLGQVIPGVGIILAPAPR